MAKKIVFSLFCGAVAGLIDVLPMLTQPIGWDGKLSAFTLWVVVGFLIGTSNLKINPVLKGILIAFLTLAPAAIIIGAIQPPSLVPIGVMTLILGSALGYTIERFA